MTPNYVLRQTVKTQMKDGIKSRPALFVKIEQFSEKEIQIRGNYKLWPLNVYNGQSYVYFIKPEGTIHYCI